MHRCTGARDAPATGAGKSAPAPSRAWRCSSRCIAGEERAGLFASAFGDRATGLAQLSIRPYSSERAFSVTAQYVNAIAAQQRCGAPQRFDLDGTANASGRFEVTGYDDVDFTWTVHVIDHQTGKSADGTRRSYDFLQTWLPAPFVDFAFLGDDAVSTQLASDPLVQTVNDAIEAWATRNLTHGSARAVSLAAIELASEP